MMIIGDDVDNSDNDDDDDDDDDDHNLRSRSCILMIIYTDNR